MLAKLFSSYCHMARRSRPHRHRSMQSTRWGVQKPSGANGAIDVPTLDHGRMPLSDRLLP